MEEEKLQSVTAPMHPSPKKQDVSNLSSRQVNSISTPPIKAYVSQKVEEKQMDPWFEDSMSSRHMDK